MSEFAVEVRKVEKVEAHPNADKLELAFLHDLAFQFVVGKGEFTPGQAVVYFPTDAILPKDLAELIGVPAKEGKETVRLKAIRLRGQRSEGVLVSLPRLSLDPKLVFVGDDLTEQLGVTKHAPPEVTGKGLRILPDHLLALPVHVHVYDIENAQRFPAVFQRMLDNRYSDNTGFPLPPDDDVLVTEKLEGTHWAASILKDGETFQVFQRRYMFKPPGEDWQEQFLAYEKDRAQAVSQMNPYWKAFFDQQFDDVLTKLHHEYRGYDITIRGELIGDGIQNNYYGAPASWRKVFVFDIELNGVPINPLVTLDWSKAANFSHVPVIYQGSLARYAANVNELVAKAHGYTDVGFKPLSMTLPSERKLREGIVVKPVVEAYDQEIGRRFLKVRDPIYLEKT